MDEEILFAGKNEIEAIGSFVLEVNEYLKKCQEEGKEPLSSIVPSDGLPSVPVSHIEDKVAPPSAWQNKYIQMEYLGYSGICIPYDTETVSCYACRLPIESEIEVSSTDEAYLAFCSFIDNYLADCKAKGEVPEEPLPEIPEFAGFVGEYWFCDGSWGGEVLNSSNGTYLIGANNARQTIGSFYVMLYSPGTLTLEATPEDEPARI